MTVRALVLPVRRPVRALTVASAYLDLCKPRLVSLILVTTLAGFYMGSAASLDYGLLLLTLAGTGLVAAGTLALNQYLESDTDALMDRTRRRPIPDGRLSPLEALVFGAAITAAGLLALALLVNPLSALVTAVTVVTYLFAYTPLKRRSALCTVIGAIPGALPPVTGWAAASGALGAGAAVIFGIMFFWQIPHSLAIAWLYREDYAKAGTRLLPTVDPGGRSTARHVVANSLALLGVGLLPTLIGLAGWIYFLAALAMGTWMLADGIRLAAATTNAGARRLLHTSLLYVPIVLLVLAIDRLPWAG